MALVSTSRTRKTGQNRQSVLSQSHTWDGTIREYLLHLQAVRAPKTVRFYEVQLRQLTRWTEENDIKFGTFGKRHLDRYLVARQGQGLAPGTLQHDAVAAKAFFRWCARNGFLDRSPLAEYEVRNAPKPARYMPSDEDIIALLNATREQWDVNKNEGISYIPIARRVFHRDRSYAILLGLVDTACRIGEILNLKMGDLRIKEREIVIRESKGKEPRTLPISSEWLEAVDDWLRTRKRIMADTPEADDPGFLFLSEYGDRMDESQFTKAVKRTIRKVGLPDDITLHSLRRYSLNRLAKYNLLAAQQIAGHKETKTTLGYTKLDADFVRDVHSGVGIVKAMVGSKREKRKKLI